MKNRIAVFLAVLMILMLACSLTEATNPSQNPPDDSNVPDGQAPDNPAKPTKKAPANPAKPTPTLKPTV